MLSLKTSKELMMIDDNGCITSFKMYESTEQEFIQEGVFPTFMMQYRMGETMVEVDAHSNPDFVRSILGGKEYIYLNVGEIGVDVTLQAYVTDDTIKFSCAVQNPNKIEVTGIAYPMLVTKYNLEGDSESEKLLYPINAGILKCAPKPTDIEPDSFHAWRFTPENGNTYHYPGQVFAQFLAYYNNRAGIYVSCNDTDGNIKIIKPVHRGGLRLGFFHAADWRESRALGYEILVKGFTGNWCDGASIYREWSSQQRWAVPLAQRKEIPDWLLDSPVHVVLRIQGRIDEGPTSPNSCFQPYENSIPLLEEVAERLKSPIVPIIMAWEAKGPWVYPECFPPAGGDESLAKFSEMARERGWHVASYCNGTRWVTGHYWSGYNGQKYFEEHKGEETVCRTFDEQLWEERWDKSWRKSYATCLEVNKTQQIAEDFCKKLADYGLDYIQFLDQNVGCATFPCYARGHGHAPMPAIWMTKAMEQLMKIFTKVQAESGRPISFALEQPCCDYFLSSIQICDVRIGPPGHHYYNNGFVPLAQFLYHEFVLFQGAFGCGQDPYHLPIRVAANFVWGAIPGGVLTEDGDFVNHDQPQPWGHWNPKIGSSADIFSIMRNATKTRRENGEPYLVYGQMQAPLQKVNVDMLKWEQNNTIQQAPAIFHCTWKSTDGKFAVALANWTNDAHNIILDDIRIGGKKNVCVPALECMILEAVAE